MPTTLVFLTTVGSGTWTVPAGWTDATFETIGGGGGSGKGSLFGTGAGGGGYGNSGSLSVTPGTVCNYNVGAGGAGTSTANGTDGGDTWIALNNTATDILSPGVASGAHGGQGSQAVTGSSGNFTAKGGQGRSATTLDPNNENSGIVLSNGNLTATKTGTGYLSVMGTNARSGGKMYFEVTVNNPGGTVSIGGALGVGVARALVASGQVTGQATGIGFDNFNATYYFNSSSGGVVAGGSAFAASGATFGVAVDFTNNNVWVFLPSNSHWNGVATDDPATNTGGLNDSTFFNGGLTSGLFGAPLFPCVSVYDSSEVTINCGASSFVHTIPTGFVAWDAAFYGSSGTSFSGGNGTGSVNTFGAVHQSSGGGGAAGPLGNGGSSGNDNTLSGYGGGGNGGGSNGLDATGSSGSSAGLGGDNHAGTGHGVSGTSNGAGTNGGGGAGGQTGINGSGGVNHSGGDGGNGTEWDSTHGSGGGGGEGDNTNTAHTGGNGGLYGGGAGNGGTSATSTGASGGQGLIVITGTFTSGGGSNLSNFFFSS